MVSDTPPPKDLVDETVEEMIRERPDLDAKTIETVCRIIFTGRKMEQFATRTLKALGINYTELDVLGSLRCAEDGRELTPAELMRAAMITSGAMSLCLDRLEKAGLVTRRKSTTDRRVRKVSLTPKGRKLIDKAFTLRFGEAERLVESLTARQLATMNTTLRVIANGSKDA